jgi:hypothetical protein
MPLFKRLSKRYGEPLRCNYCGQIITPKEIISKIQSNNSDISVAIKIMKNQTVVSMTTKHGTKHYHSECYEKLFID